MKKARPEPGFFHARQPGRGRDCSYFDAALATGAAALASVLAAAEAAGAAALAGAAEAAGAAALAAGAEAWANAPIEKEAAISAAKILVMVLEPIRD